MPTFRRLITATLLGVALVSTTALAFQGSTRSNAAKPAPGACTLLTKDVLTAHSPASKESLNLMLAVPPQESPSGRGTLCSYGGVTMQVDPTATIDNFPGTPVPGVGDRAVFHDRRGRFAELAVISGGRVVTLQIGIPTGRTAESVKPNAVALAKAILEKLR